MISFVCPRCGFTNNTNSIMCSNCNLVLNYSLRPRITKIMSFLDHAYAITKYCKYGTFHIDEYRGRGDYGLVQEAEKIMDSCYIVPLYVCGMCKECKLEVEE